MKEAKDKGNQVHGKEAESQQQVGKEEAPQNQTVVVKTGLLQHSPVHSSSKPAD